MSFWLGVLKFGRYPNLFFIQLAIVKMYLIHNNYKDKYRHGYIFAIKLSYYLTEVRVHIIWLSKLIPSLGFRIVWVFEYVCVLQDNVMVCNVEWIIINVYYNIEANSVYFTIWSVIQPQTRNFDVLIIFCWNFVEKELKFKINRSLICQKSNVRGNH